LESGRFSTGYQPYPGVIVSTFGAMSRTCPFEGISGNYSETICKAGIDRKFIDFYNELYLKYGSAGSLRRLKEVIDYSRKEVDVSKIETSDQFNDALVTTLSEIQVNSMPTYEEAENFVRSNPENYEDYIITLFSDDAHMIKWHGLFPRNFGQKLSPRILCKVLGLGKYAK
jgi:hypothetical protein